MSLQLAEFLNFGKPTTALAATRRQKLINRPAAQEPPNVTDGLIYLGVEWTQLQVIWPTQRTALNSL